MFPYLFRPTIRNISTLAIRDVDKPSCTNCIHYKPEFEYGSVLNKCTEFGGKDLHTGEILFDFANTVRSDESKCGKEGTHFKPDPYVCVKRTGHTIVRSLPFIVIVGVCLLNLVVSFNNL
jgi:hypothetical protein